VTEADWETAFPLAKNAENIVVTRTFSKIHGLGGLRIGFGYAPQKVAEAIDRIRLPFNVSVPGLEAATAALSDTAHQTASRDLVTNWKPRLTQALRGFGLEVLPSAGNFVLVVCKDAARAAAANDYLNTKGIIVRPVGGYGLPQALRITIGTEDQNRAVIDALSEFAAG
jgi:histidinol-phosphate aminotransferase